MGTTMRGLVALVCAAVLLACGAGETMQNAEELGQHIVVYKRHQGVLAKGARLSIKAKARLVQGVSRSLSRERANGTIFI